MKRRRIIGSLLMGIAAVLIVVLTFSTPDLGIRMSVLDATPKGCTLICIRGLSAGSVITGSEYFLDRYTDKGWEPVQYISEKSDVAWTMEAYPIRTGCIRFCENWEYLYGTLPAGTYRIGTCFIREGTFKENEYLTLYARFRIENR